MRFKPGVYLKDDGLTLVVVEDANYKVIIRNTPCSLVKFTVSEDGSEHFFDDEVFEYIKKHWFFLGEF